ncbi:unnamed protein product [Mesocestoides corti]|uniref:Uncharacterized protein n=1 Tax=Mesocestoides corti TaxID=53468 RepID=A0A0R3UBF4_MESCO|nr:unnamed protein product [Mesocestoides corti]
MPLDCRHLLPFINQNKRHSHKRLLPPPTPSPPRPSRTAPKSRTDRALWCAYSTKCFRKPQKHKLIRESEVAEFKSNHTANSSAVLEVLAEKVNFEMFA